MSAPVPNFRETIPFSIDAPSFRFTVPKLNKTRCRKKSRPGVGASERAPSRACVARRAGRARRKKAFKPSNTFIVIRGKAN
jgi:hypothetical protein